MPKSSDRFLASFAPIPPAKDRLAFDTDCPGLGVRAGASGKKTFLVQWTDAVTGRKGRQPLDTWGSMTLEQARTSARIRLGRVEAGFDPMAERDTKKAEDLRQRLDAAATKREAAFTLEVLITEWEKLHLAARRPGLLWLGREAPEAGAESLRQPSRHRGRLLNDLEAGEVWRAAATLGAIFLANQKRFRNRRAHIMGGWDSGATSG